MKLHHISSIDDNRVTYVIRCSCGVEYTDKYKDRALAGVGLHIEQANGSTINNSGKRTKLTKKGKRILAEMKKKYGSAKGEQVFYKSISSGTIIGVEEGKP
jgi:hypothetical protein